MNGYTNTATYSPDDNKLRLYPSTRLDQNTYERVKSAGFKWAPRQGLFVASMWTPCREDLLLELRGEIGDEDKSLTDRAEDRAERFDEYSDKRASEAEGARRAVAAIADGIPLGQPILVGHHSERRARKDAEKIENGMRRAVQMWETSEYWKRRAAGALSYAKYKELPAVRHRRIKGLEADKRKKERAKQESKKWLKLWLECEAEHNAEQQRVMALRIADMCWLHLPRKEGDREDFNLAPTAYSVLTNTHLELYAPRTLAEVIEAAKATYPATIAHCDRWITHYEHRISYERAMLDEQGGLKAEGFDIQPGGRVLIDSEWLVVLRINKKGGDVSSVTTNARYVRVRGIEEVKDYRAPTEEEAAKVKKVNKLPPIVNFPGDGFIEMTTETYKKLANDSKHTRTVEATAEHGAYRYRAGFLPNGGWRAAQVYITDAKRVEPPAPDAGEAVRFEPELEIMQSNNSGQMQVSPSDSAEFKAMREQLKNGVHVVSAPQLFPTPKALADYMVDLVRPQIGARVLEPSAGTGRLLGALPGVLPLPYSNRQTACDVVAVEINQDLAHRIESAGLASRVLQADFLTLKVNDLGGKFDCVVMNPPFENGADIKHIQHALGMLKPGGRLVAICANGPRQRAQLLPLVEQLGGQWQDLPPNTFAESGTTVNAALLTVGA